MPELLRDDPGAFTGAIEAAVDRVGYPGSILLKDYWVCEILRALRSPFAGEFLFKGGTSLAKGWSLIERMSEDVDLLINERVRETNAEREARLLSLTETAADATGLTWHEFRQPGRGRDAHRDDIFLLCRPHPGYLFP